MTKLQRQQVLPGGLQDNPTDKGYIAPVNRARSTERAKSIRKTGIIANARVVNFVITTEANTSVSILPFNGRRASLIIQNKGVNPVYIAFDTAANKNALEIAAGGSHEPNIAPVNAINLYATIDGESVTVVEGTG